MIIRQDVVVAEKYWKSAYIDPMQVIISVFGVTIVDHTAANPVIIKRRQKHNNA